MPYATPPAPELPLEATEESFWNVVEEIAGDVQIHPGSRHMLEQMIKAGLKKMRDENRTTTGDLLLARGSLATFLIEVKREAQLAGHADWWGEDSTEPVGTRLATMGIVIWPFIPPPWAKRR